ncbi:MAG: zinc-dependent alcohol dehydrogenase [Pseudomonas sp.]
MKAVVFHAVGDIRLEQVDEPVLQSSTDAIVRLTASAICGTDLHFVRGSISGMRPGTILGHEGVGIVETLGTDVRNLQVGDRVLISPTIACGNCTYCRAGYYAQCDTANPNGSRAGTAFFGGPESSGAFHGLQAEKARIPYAHIGLVKLPDEITDEQAILLSDVFPTGYFGAEMAEVTPGDTVAVFGCGPVGQFAIASAKLLGASRVFAIDNVPDRLAMASQQGAETINFDEEDPVATLQRLTADIGVDRAIDAVGVDAEPSATLNDPQLLGQFRSEMARNTTQTNPDGDNWHPGNAPSQALQWAVEGLAKAGTLSIIGLYSPQSRSFPIGLATSRNLTINMGNCHHRQYIPTLIELVLSGRIDPTHVLTRIRPLQDSIEAFKEFDRRACGWAKVALLPPEDETENQLDEALDESFPASDPPSMASPKR